MKPKRLNPKKNKAQAMVEFAIALPILLMLLYGLLEVGRLLFTYSSVVNATRQAVRWGSTTGVGDDGSTPRYQDCAGIKASAQRGDFLNVFNDADITITYDSGPGTSSLGTCPVNITGNDKRIMVSINYNFRALVPKLVPFISRTVANGNPMNATSARTIITSITIDMPDDVTKENTATFITSDDPDPSEIGEPVLVSVTVTGTSTTPTGSVIVTITGAGTGCTIPSLDSSGAGSCYVTFNSISLSPSDKTITATYSGDTTHNASSDDDNHTVDPASTTTIITSDVPDPSIVNNAVTINVVVISAWGTPTGTVAITGADTNCTVTLSGGRGSCSVTFNSIGGKTLTAAYSGDTEHAVSQGEATHTVGPVPPATPTNTPGPSPTPAPTSTPTPPSCSISYVPSSWSNGFWANVVITNDGGTALNGWTLTWNFTAGQVITNYWNVNLVQTGGSVTASDLSWNALIGANGGTQSFGFQGTHSGSNPSPTDFSINGVPCTGGEVPPTATPTPSLTPTGIPTGVSCAQLSHGAITFSGDTMKMTINNSTGIPLDIQNVTVWWNSDEGRGSGNGDLQLQNSALGISIYWTGSVTAPSYTITPSPSVSIPTGASTISFKFKFNYAITNGSERILINLSTPTSCGFIDSNIP